MQKAVSIIFLVLTQLLFSCQTTPEEKPEDILSKDKFKQMVIDFHLLEAHVEDKYGKSDSTLTIFKELERQLYEKNQTTDKIYLKTYNYYLRNADTEMDPIYEEIVNELSKLESRTKGELKK